MKTYGTLHPTENANQAPDTKQTLLIAASSGQALDWASTLSQIVRLSGISTAGAAINFFVSLNSTSAAAPSSGTSTGTTAGALPSMPVMGEGTFQIPAGSTCWSVAGLSSGYITAEVWRM